MRRYVKQLLISVFGEESIDSMKAIESIEHALKEMVS